MNPKPGPWGVHGPPWPSGRMSPAAEGAFPSCTEHAVAAGAVPLPVPLLGGLRSPGWRLPRAEGGPGCSRYCFSQTHQTIVVQLLQSTTRLLECPWLQQQHKGSVEACIRTLAVVGECRAGALQAPPRAAGTPAPQ